MKPVFYFLVFATFIGLCVAKEQKNAIDMRVELCHFDLPEVVLRANVTFRVVIRFEVDEKGQPINIEMINDESRDYLKKEQVVRPHPKSQISCLNLACHSGNQIS